MNDAIRDQVEASEIDMNSYTAIKLKSVRLQSISDRKRGATGRKQPNPPPGGSASSNRGLKSNMVGNGDSGREKATREKLCFKCKKPGHLARDCTEKWESDLKELEQSEDEIDAGKDVA